jgi:hypothetical protein
MEKGLRQVKPLSGEVEENGLVGGDEVDQGWRTEESLKKFRDD